MKIPKGFRFGGVACGLKPSRRDLALVVSDHPAAAAGVFTRNKAPAAPVQDARPRVPAEGMRAIVANSGNANALTGPAGMDDVSVIRSAVADALGIQKRAVLTASTGVIGARMPAMKIVTALPALVEQLGDHPDLAAEAIMTTDSRPKMAAREVTLGGKSAVVCAVCKGSGMLAPQLATTVCLVTTDAAVTPKALQDVLARAVQQTLNMVSVDGEMSTNDCVLVLANGLAGNARISEPGPDLDVLENALTDLLGEMARAMAADGEGATRMMEVVVDGGAVRGDRARVRARHRLLAPRQDRAVRRRSELGSDPRHRRRAGGSAGLAGGPVPGAGDAPGRPGVREGRAGRVRPRVAPGADAGEPGRRPRRARRGHRARGRVGLRSLVRLREDQRRLLEPHLPEAGRRGREGRPRLELQPRVQADAARRGAQVHRRVLGGDRRHQVRRRCDGEGELEGGVRRGRHAAEARRA